MALPAAHAPQETPLWTAVQQDQAAPQELLDRVREVVRAGFLCAAPQALETQRVSQPSHSGKEDPMPRSSTGTPCGRPPSSRLGVGNQVPRLRVRFPPALYARLEAFATQSRSHRGDPSLAVCVRDMVTFCLDHPDLFQQPVSVSPPASELFRRPEKAPAPATEVAVISWQPATITAPAPQMYRSHYRQPENAPAFDATRYFVGGLCTAGHRYQGQARSLRYLRGNQNCVTCRRERNQRYNARKRERQSWQQTAPQRG
jgi:hypothetical protein